MEARLERRESAWRRHADDNPKKAAMNERNQIVAPKNKMDELKKALMARDSGKEPPAGKDRNETDRLEKEMRTKQFRHADLKNAPAKSKVYGKKICPVGATATAASSSRRPATEAIPKPTGTTMPESVRLLTTAKRQEHGQPLPWTTPTGLRGRQSDGLWRKATVVGRTVMVPLRPLKNLADSSL